MSTPIFANGAMSNGVAPRRSNTVSFVSTATMKPRSCA